MVNCGVRLRGQGLAPGGPGPRAQGLAWPSSSAGGGPGRRRPTPSATSSPSARGRRCSFFFLRWRRRPPLCHPRAGEALRAPPATPAPARHVHPGTRRMRPWGRRPCPRGAPGRNRAAKKGGRAAAPPPHRAPSPRNLFPPLTRPAPTPLFFFPGARLHPRPLHVRHPLHDQPQAQVRPGRGRGRAGRVCGAGHRGQPPAAPGGGLERRVEREKGGEQCGGGAPRLLHQSCHSDA